MRHVAGTALTFAAAFLSLMALLIDAPALFYMSFALIATIIASNVQAGRAIRGLEIERSAPATVFAGEWATVSLAVKAARGVRRPLVTIRDGLPAGMHPFDVSPSLPVAPHRDHPVRTEYRFRPGKRGVFRIARASVTGADALGLVPKSHAYATEATTVTVCPRRFNFDVTLPSGGGLGASEAISGSVRGAGIEPRGLREYVPGDALRYVDWRASARTNRLQVKEFEAGTHGNVTIVLQRHPALDSDAVAFSAFDAMLGHALGLAARLANQGVRVTFAGIGPEDGEPEIALARIVADDPDLANQVAEAVARGPVGATIVLFAGAAENLEEAIRAARGASIAAILYNPTDYGPAPGAARDGIRGATAAVVRRFAPATSVAESVRRMGAMVLEAPVIPPADRPGGNS